MGNFPSSLLVLLPIARVSSKSENEGIADHVDRPPGGALRRNEAVKVKLISNDMWSPPLQLTLNSFPVVIGRNGKSDLAIDDRWTSDMHCELQAVDGVLRVRDLSSEHGTFVNGQPVTDGAAAPGDTLTIGIRSFRVSYRRDKSNSTNSRSNRGLAGCVPRCKDINGAVHG